MEQALEVVAPLCEDVRQRGEEAVLEYGERFDRVRPASLRVDPAELTRAADALDADVRAGLEASIERLRRTCEAELEQTVTTEVAAGATVERRIVPMSRVGLYVPGGLAPLVSTVVMNAVPAQVAGVGSIALASPPQADANGLPHPTILAACSILGIDEVYAAGGAQALAMFAYGTTSTGGSVEPVDLVTGPGNIYVAAAKRHLQGTVAIDSEAGPTEIAIIADATADAGFVAADLISQAEHDPMAASILITDDDDPRRRRRGRAGAPGADGQARRTDPDRPRGAAVGDRPGPRPRPGRRRRQRLRGRAPRDPHGRRRRRLRPASSTPARSSSAHTRRSRWATTSPARTTCCPPVGAHATPRDSRCARSARTSRS